MRKKQTVAKRVQFAVVAQHGDDEIEYVTVAIQDRPMTKGGRLIASMVFYADDYAAERSLVDAVIHWAVHNHGAEAIQMMPGLLPPHYCQSHGLPSIAVLD